LERASAPRLSRLHACVYAAAPCPGHGWRLLSPDSKLLDHATSQNPRVSVNSLPNMEENNLKKSEEPMLNAFRGS
ncbi:MAG: hypothetical protein LZ174_09955, partial [Thaumarchaeota archaeon]|jgi:hypothetical protein|nr:hypothetical protein [Candidatus Geocrenenecus arthurdayi]